MSFSSFSLCFGLLKFDDVTNFNLHHEEAALLAEDPSCRSPLRASNVLQGDRQTGLPRATPRRQQHPVKTSVFVPPTLFRWSSTILNGLRQIQLSSRAVLMDKRQLLAKRNSN